MSQIVISKDLRPRFGPVRDQGDRPTCLAFAASDAHQAVRTGCPPLSCEYLFFQAHRRAGTLPHLGIRIATVRDALREDGQPVEADWPYLDALPADLGGWVPPATIGPTFQRLGARISSTLGSVTQALDDDYPVVVASKLPHSFFNPPADGIFHPVPGEAFEPGLSHAVVAVGHGTAAGHRAVLVRNSWGPGWALGGHAWLTEAFVDQGFYDALQLLEEP